MAWYRHACLAVQLGIVLGAAHAQPHKVLEVMACRQRGQISVSEVRRQVASRGRSPRNVSCPRVPPNLQHCSWPCHLAVQGNAPQLAVEGLACSCASRAACTCFSSRLAWSVGCNTQKSGGAQRENGRQALMSVEE